jgi:hypothetical protein
MLLILWSVLHCYQQVTCAEKPLRWYQPLTMFHTYQSEPPTSFAESLGNLSVTEVAVSSRAGGGRAARPGTPHRAARGCRTRPGRAPRSSWRDARAPGRSQLPRRP